MEMREHPELTPFNKYILKYAEWIEWVGEEIRAMTPPCTKKQRAFIYGCCRKLGYNPRFLPEHISSVFEPREMSIFEAEEALDKLIAEVEATEAEYYETYGEKKSYRKKKDDGIF